MTFELSADQIEALQKIVILCREHKDGPELFTYAEIERALERYPGALTKNEVFPNQYTLNSLVRACVQQLDLEDQSRSLTTTFLFRLLEQKWHAQPLRHKVVEATPKIVRPPRGFANEDVLALINHLDTALGALPQKPGPGSIGDREVFKRLGENRETVVGAVRALDQLESLKAVHDSLQILQVLGGASLDQSASLKSEAAAELSSLVAFAVLPSFAESLSNKAAKQLAKLGVQVMTGAMVERIDDRGVTVGGKLMRCGAVLWTAGVSPSPIHDAIYSARGATLSQRAQRALSKVAIAAE